MPAKAAVSCSVSRRQGYSNSLFDFRGLAKDFGSAGNAASVPAPLQGLLSPLGQSRQLDGIAVVGSPLSIMKAGRAAIHSITTAVPPPHLSCLGQKPEHRAPPLGPAPPRASDAGAPVGRFRDWFARAGTSRRRRPRGEIPGPPSLPGLGTVWRQRNGGRFHLGSGGQGLPLRTHKPLRHHRSPYAAGAAGQIVAAKPGGCGDARGGSYGSGLRVSVDGACFGEDVVVLVHRDGVARAAGLQSDLLFDGYIIPCNSPPETTRTQITLHRAVTRPDPAGAGYPRHTDFPGLGGHGRRQGRPTTTKRITA
ncbi:hypothetical protein ABIE00_000215 [Arthrobacter sp. OAP107]